MLLVDSQVHIWGADTPERPWPERVEPQRLVPLGKNDLLREMNAAGVDRVVIVRLMRWAPVAASPHGQPRTAEDAYPSQGRGFSGHEG